MRTNALLKFDKFQSIVYAIHMNADSETELPKIRLATESWVEKHMADTELRLERAFHDQTKMLYGKLSEMNNSLNQRLNQQTLAIVLAILAVGAALVGTVFFK